MKHHCDLVRSVSMPALPSSMQVVRAPEPGDADALSFESQPLPKVGDLDVLIRVGAAGLNRLDIFQREGRYPPPRGVTDVLGLEVAGEVAFDRAAQDGSTYRATGVRFDALPVAVAERLRTFLKDA